MPNNNNNTNNENTGVVLITPVGVTIARSKRNRRKSLKKEECKPKKKSNKIAESSNNNNNNKTDSTNKLKSTLRSTAAAAASLSSLSTSSYQKPVSSWSLFWEGSAVYAACLIIPTVMAYILRHHEYQISMQELQQQQQQQQQTASTSSSSSLTLFSTTLDLVYSLAMEYIWTEPVSEMAAYYLCPAENGPIVQYLGTDYMPTWSWCPKPPLQDEKVFLMSPDAAWTDLNVVVLISFTLALIRIIIVRIVLGSTNFKDSTRMHALIKCKSTHLLSRDYHLTPCGTPVLTKPRKIIQPQEIATAVAAAAAATAAAAASTTTYGAATTTMQCSSSSLLSRASSTGLVLPNMDDDDHVDDDNALDDNDDYVNVGLLWDDPSDHVPILAPRPTAKRLATAGTTTGTASPFLFPPGAPPLSNGPVVQQQQHHQGPDSPLEYLTDASIRRCNSTSSGLGGQRSRSSQRLLSPPPMTASGAAAASSPSSCTLASLSSLSIIRVVPTNNSRPERLYAAPRLATAVFRLAYTTVSVVLAWHSFYTADFWPWYVGGGMMMTGSGSSRGRLRAGSTVHVWDLNGGAVSVGILDSDFDLRNTVLRRYFLVQASYHFHSTAFHVLSMIIFLIQNYRSNNKNKNDENTTTVSSSSANPQSPSTTSLSSSLLVNKSSPLSASSPPASSSYSMNGIWKVSTTSYLRSLLHHALALLTLGTAYIFSSLRRLVAIGMFAFDVSSWFLHLLQICVNAKNDNNNKNDDDDNNNDKDKKDDASSWWQHLLTASRIQCFHFYFVLPSFVYCRFGVWGALWYSALTESHAWLQQLERTLFPNAALMLQSLWNVCMAGLFVANLIYLHRLLHHPHLKRIRLLENNK